MLSHLLFIFKGRSSGGGFTVLEAVFAVSILAVGILAVASLQGSAIKSNGSAVELADATARIASELERLTMLPFTHEDLSAEAEENPHVSDADPQITWSVNDSPSGDMKTVSITVTWEDHGVTKNLSMHHILTNPRS